MITLTNDELDVPNDAYAGMTPTQLFRLKKTGGGLAILEQWWSGFGKDKAKWLPIKVVEIDASDKEGLL